MNQITLSKTLTLCVLLGSIVLKVSAQTGVDKANHQIDTMNIDGPVKEMLLPILRLRDIELTTDDESVFLDHDPSLYYTPEALADVNWNVVDEKIDFSIPDKDPGIEMELVQSADNAAMDFVDIKIYPNPATEYINIDLSSLESVSIKLIDGTGRVVLNQQSEHNIPVQIIDLRVFKSGVYILIVETSHWKDSRTVVIRSI